MRLLPIILIISGVILAPPLSVSAQKSLTPEQYRAMVVEKTQADAETTDSVGTALVVAGYGKDVDDFILIPVFSRGKVSAVYRNDSERSSITQIASSLVLRSVRPGLFSQRGAVETFKGIKISNPQPQLISCGPFSLFGTLGAGWYQKTGDSFVLLALNGRIVNEAEVSDLWPEKVELLKSIDSEKNDDSGE